MCSILKFGFCSLFLRLNRCFCVVLDFFVQLKFDGVVQCLFFGLQKMLSLSFCSLRLSCFVSDGCQQLSDVVVLGLLVQYVVSSVGVIVFLQLLWLLKIWMLLSVRFRCGLVSVEVLFVVLGGWQVNRIIVMVVVSCLIFW